MPSVLRTGFVLLNRTIKAELTAAEGLAGTTTFAGLSFRLRPDEKVHLNGLHGTVACNSSGDINPNNRADLVVFEDLEVSVTQQYNGTIWSDNIALDYSRLRYYQRFPVLNLADSDGVDFTEPLKLDRPAVVYTLLMGFITGIAAPPGGYRFYFTPRGVYIPAEEQRVTEALI